MLLPDLSLTNLLYLLKAIRLFACSLLVVLLACCLGRAQDAITFEMRALYYAVPQVGAGSVQDSDLGEEMERLRKWLGEVEHREAVKNDLQNINLYNWLSQECGGPTNRSIGWYPRIIRESEIEGVWQFAFSMIGPSSIGVALFSEKDWSEGPGGAGNIEELVEFIPVHRAGTFFSGEDLVRRLRVRTGRLGYLSLEYSIAEQKLPLYDEWIRTLPHGAVAQVINGIVTDAYIVHGALPGYGFVSTRWREESRQSLLDGTWSKVEDSWDTHAVRVLKDPESKVAGIPAYGHVVLETDEMATRVAAVRKLGEHGQGSKCAAEYLLRLLEVNPGKSVVREVVTALGMIGPAAKDAIPTLENLTEHDDLQIVQRAKAALRQIRG